MQKHVVCDGAWLYFRIIFLVLTFLHSATGHWHAILNDQAYVLYSEHWKSGCWKSGKRQNLEAILPISCMKKCPKSELKVPSHNLVVLS